MLHSTYTPDHELLALYALDIAQHFEQQFLMHRLKHY